MFYRMVGDASAECGVRSAELGAGKGHAKAWTPCADENVQDPKLGNIDPPFASYGAARR